MRGRPARARRDAGDDRHVHLHHAGHRRRRQHGQQAVQPDHPASAAATPATARPPSRVLGNHPVSRARRAQRTAECRWTMGGAHSGTPRAHRRKAAPKSSVDPCLSAAQRSAGSRCRHAGVLRCRTGGQSSPGRPAAAQAARWPSRRPARHRPRRQPDRREQPHCHVLDIGHRPEISRRCSADDRRSAPAPRLILPNAYPKSRQSSSRQVASDRSAALKNATGGLDS
jgi:hypothetical protein